MTVVYTTGHYCSELDSPMKILLLPLLKKNNYRRLLVFGLGLLVALTVALYFFPTIAGIFPMSNPNQVVSSTGWKRYTHPLFGYSLQYPPYWTISDISPEQSTDGTLSVVRFHHQDVFNSSLVISVADKSIDRIIKKEDQYGHGRIIKKQPIMVKRISGWRLDVDATSWNDQMKTAITVRRILIMLPSASKTITLTYTPSAVENKNISNDSSVIQVFDKILTSFTVQP